MKALEAKAILSESIAEDLQARGKWEEKWWASGAVTSFHNERELSLFSMAAEPKRFCIWLEVSLK